MVVTTQEFGQLTVVKEVDEESGEMEIRIEGLNLPSEWIGCE